VRRRGRDWTPLLCPSFFRNILWMHGQKSLKTFRSLAIPHKHKLKKHSFKECGILYLQMMAAQEIVIKVENPVNVSENSYD
jgi:hypothetical protein